MRSVGRFIRSPFLLQTGLVLALSILTVQSFAQRPGPKRRQRPPSSGITPTRIPFPFLAKNLTFKHVVLDKKKFNEAVAHFATLPAGFGGKLKKPQMVAQLEYGYKKGGLTCVYETPAVPGVSLEAMTKMIVDARIFKDVNDRPGWKIVGKTINGVFVAATSINPGVPEAAVDALVFP